MKYLKLNSIKQYIKTGILLVLSLQSKASSQPCNSSNTTLFCIQVWGPLNGYNATPNLEVESKCFTALDCCPDFTNTSITGFDDCEWKDCEDTNSSAYCREWSEDYNSTVDKCFEDHGCCPVSQNTTNTSNTTNTTGYTSWCPSTPPASLSETTLFFIVESSVLLSALIGSGLAHWRQYSKTLKGGIAMICIAVGGLLGTGIAAIVDKEFKLSDDSSSLHLSSTGGILLGAGLFAKGFYDFVLRENVAPAVPPVALLPGGGPGGVINAPQPYVSCCNCIIS